jgi:5-(carboxyamino)imidazole ribonucleotide mutase
MPAGVPVATVALNGAKNAGILAVQILGSNNENLAKALDLFKDNLGRKVEESALALEKKGWKEYLQ